nr:PREDICTED: basic helix-loop-helix domain-containing protein KIAA2018 homolog isoform X2 [Latimeria chalumnae]|eukprot:XP_014346286.1 PREDICTED: basic helix-loop-helix domain-containing protein KIAA2018 homolog isoform X2 [Latimeria chalumnae]
MTRVSELLPCSPALKQVGVAMPEMTENQTPPQKPHRKKNRETHNAVERHRKKKINAGINRISELIPCSPALKRSKNMILDQAVKYIAELKRQNDELLLNGGNREQAEEIKRLRKQLEEMQRENGRYIELLKANDICLYDDPTIHWKGNLKSTRVAMVIPTNQVQESIIVYSNGNNQGAPVQNISFNVGQNLQKQTANVVPVQRTCNIVTPVTIPNICPMDRGALLSTAASVMKQQDSVPVLLDSASTREDPNNVSHAAVSNTHAAPQVAGCSGPQRVAECSPGGITHGVSDSSRGELNSELLRNNSQDISRSTSACLILPPQQAQNHCVTNQDPKTSAQEISARSSQSAVLNHSTAAAQNVPAAVISNSTVLTKSSVGLVTSVAVQSAHTDNTPPLCSSDSSWTLASSLPASGFGATDLRSVNAPTRITSTGNTHTTWTTLQLAGNTVQPLSQMPSSIMPALLTEATTTVNSISSAATTTAAADDRLPANRVHVNNPAALQGVPLCAGGGQVIQQVAVTLPSVQSLPMQPLLASAQVPPPPAANVVPLQPAMQMIQMAQPVGASVHPPPANQNVIILQPPNPSAAPAVMGGSLANQALGQPIVIIQAPNQNQFSIVPAPPSAVRMPLIGANQAVCSVSAGQNAPVAQTFGGKHLVHILPRPVSSSASSSTQSVSVTMPGKQQQLQQLQQQQQQQQQTISVSGQLFALQPVMPSSNVSSQAPMQIIQPTTSEDPNTNVALNTFGALASLNQSISQMAGQSCVQLTVGQPANPSVTVGGQVVSSSSTAPGTMPVTNASSSVPSAVLTVMEGTTTNTGSPSKSVTGLPSSLKPKRVPKKSNSSKQPVLGKRTLPASQSKASDTQNSTSVEKPPQPSVTEGQASSENSLTEVIASPVSQSSATPLVTSENASLGTSKEVLNTQWLDSGASTGDPCATRGCMSSVASEEVTLATETSISTDRIPNIQPSSKQSRATVTESLNSCVMSNISAPSSQFLSPSQHSSAPANLGSSSFAAGNVCSASGAVTISDPPVLVQDSLAVIQASSMLTEQGINRMLSDLSKDKESGQRDSQPTKNLSSDNSRPMDSGVDLSDKQDLLLANGESDTIPQACISDQEAIGSSLITGRQTDSPMSTSSGSSRSFSVASMLPDVTREDVLCHSTVTNTFSSCTFPGQADIVALAAREIFDQEDLEKGRGTAGVDVREASSKATEAASLKRERQSQQPIRAQGLKENDPRLPESMAAKLHPPELVQTDSDRPLEKNPSVVDAPNVPLQLSTLQTSATAVSLSINNLIHQGAANHSIANHSNLTPHTEQQVAPTTIGLPISSSSYITPSSGPALVTEYSHEQLNAMRVSTMQTNQVQELQLKQSSETRKEAPKRTVQDDLLTSAKRQKHCQAAAVRLDGAPPMSRAPDSLLEHTQMLLNPMLPSSSSSAPSVGNQEHNRRLFSPSNNYNSVLRQIEIQCSVQPSMQEQQSHQRQGQVANQHLLQQHQQQHIAAPPVLHLHNNNPYLKQQQQQQQQQQGQLRERHRLYQLQHHVSQPESTVLQPPSNVHQQRSIQQEVQMHKKRGLVRGTQTTQLSMQQKQRLGGNEQARQKGSQAHSHHQQLQQQMQQQQQQQHFGPPHPEKGCENPTTSRSHHVGHTQSHLNQEMMHQQQQEVGNRKPGTGVPAEHMSGQNQIQRLMTSRALEQQMASQTSVVSRPADVTCTPHRQERNRVSSYSAEALIGKTPSNSEQRIGISAPGTRVSEQQELRNYVDVSRSKGLVVHNMQTRLPVDHPEVQHLVDCQPFKSSGPNQQPVNTFEVQPPRNGEMANALSTHRGMQTQGFRIGQNTGPLVDRQKRLSYPPVQSISTGNTVPQRENENACHQGFMQSLLQPHLGEPMNANQRAVAEHQRMIEMIEFSFESERESPHIRRESEGPNRESCDMSMGAISSRNSSLSIPFSNSSSSADIQGRNTSPQVAVQKSNSIRMSEGQGNKSHMNAQVSGNMHGIVRPVLPHPAVSHGNTDQGQSSVRQPNSSISQRSRHPAQDNSGSKIRQAERSRSGNQRHGNVFDPSISHFPLTTSASMILGRQQPTAAERRGSIVRFMADGPQVSNKNIASGDQHTLSQNFGFPFISEGGMNPPINTNASFIPPVTQPSATRTPALLPVEPQNTLPSFYPPYPPAHASLSSDISIPYFSNQMFTSPSTDKTNGGGLNNRFGSLLSPPRPVGFAQSSFPLLPDMPPMPVANTSHLSNFNLTSLFPEIAAALPPDGSSMQMSPLLTIANSSVSDSSKQSTNRPAHNISHILGHDGNSAV